MTRIASAVTGQTLAGKATAVAIAPAMIAYSTAIVSNARRVERRVKRRIFAPPCLDELNLEAATGTAHKPKKNPSWLEIKSEQFPSVPKIMIFARAHHPLQEGAKGVDAAEFIPAHA